MTRYAPAVVCALAAASMTFGGATVVQAQDFPQIKINHVDTSEAPKVRVYASVLGRGLKPIMADQLDELTLLRKPKDKPAQELFTFADGEIRWPKSLTEEEIKEKEEAPPELMPAVDMEKGAAIVVVVPGFQAEEYRDGELGNRSRNGAGLFFKKLGKANKMNAIWYNDFVWSWVETAGRTTQLSRLDTQLERCEKWEREQLPMYGAPPEEGEEEAAGLAPNEAHCGLTSEYADIGDYIQKSPYSGFWPQLFGLPQRICVEPKEQFKMQTTGLRARQREGVDPNDDGRVKALDVGLWMLTKHSDPGQPRILVLTGDGRDGYIQRHDDCKMTFMQECPTRPEVAEARAGTAREKAINACVDKEMRNLFAQEQSAFAQRLDAWLGLAKAAGIRIYSVAHPTAEDFQADRLAVLAWRTGGTARRATDANDVVARYEDLIGELNHQMVFTFVDDEALPGADVSYEVWAKAKSNVFKTPAFEAKVAPAVDKPLLTEFTSFGQGKLGKTGFYAALAGVGLILLLIFFKIGKKIFGGGAKAVKGAAAKGAKGAKGAKPDKAREKAIKAALKKKQKLAKAKAKAKG